MKTRRCLIPASGLLITLTAGLISYAGSAPASDRPDQAPAAIVIPRQASRCERLAALEVRRYLYLQTGELLPVANSLPQDRDAIVIGTWQRFEQGWLADTPLEAHRTGLGERSARLAEQGYFLWTADGDTQQVLFVVGKSDPAVLYAAYRLAECYGVRFYLEGDVVPDRRLTWSLAQLDEVRNPLFALRGIQPFHDFPEGPDWWGREEYKAILAQLPKLGMNFIGLHCYPEGGVGPEPLVWIGLPQDIGEGPHVQFSYPARHFLTSNVTGAWGYRPMKTSDYTFGADQLFDVDDFGADYMRGYSPWTEMSLEQSNRLFAAMGELLKDAFTFARELGIVTTVGTETPLTIPRAVRERLKSLGKDPSNPAVIKEVYAGIFRRIMQTHPLDYYWLWTPEGWTWSATKQDAVDATLNDLRLAYEAAQEVHAPFTLATCGWVLGPTQDRALFDRVLPKEMPVSCINRQVGHDPVEPGFARVKDRPKWAIPWLEDDPALNSPQLWVGRMRKDAADALAYGCTGLMGIHWRTRQLGPNVSALAAAAWDQQGWNPTWGKPLTPPPPLPEGPEGGKYAAFPGVDFADTEEDVIYQTVRYDVDAYRFDVPNGQYQVVLKLCEPHYSEAGKRVFGIAVQGKTILERLDLIAQVGKNRAFDVKVENVTVDSGRLEITFPRIEEFPCIAGIVIEGPVTRKINCGGPAWQDYAADWPPAESHPDRHLMSEDFYLDWASVQFGPEAAAEIAAILAEVDGHLPRPSNWVGGPGGIQPDARPWEQVAQEYHFVERLEALRDRIQGPGNRERFDDWLNLFRYMRANAWVNCLLARYQAAVNRIKGIEDPARRKAAAQEEVFPARAQLVAGLADVHHYLLAHVRTYGGLGNVANWQQHVLPMTLGKTDADLEALLAEKLPAESALPKTYTGSGRVIVPSARTLLMKGEPLRLRVIVLGMEKPQMALYWRSPGEPEYHLQPVSHVARGVYRAEIAPQQLPEIVEYFIEAQAADQVIRYPATAPQMGLTTVVLP
jgi:hypothetical protein